MLGRSVVRLPLAVSWLDESVSSVREQSLLVVEESTWTGQEEHGSSHVAVVTSPLSWVGWLHVKRALVVFARVSSGHLTWEDTGGDVVDADLGVGEGGGEHTADVGCGGLGCGVGELTVAGTLHKTGDGGDVDDLRGVARSGLTALGEERQKSHGHPVSTANVRLHGVGPLLRSGLEEVFRDGLRVGHVGLAVASYDRTLAIQFHIWICVS